MGRQEKISEFNNPKLFDFHLILPSLLTPNIHDLTNLGKSLRLASNFACLK